MRNRRSRKMKKGEASASFSPPWFHDIVTGLAEKYGRCATRLERGIATGRRLYAFPDRVYFPRGEIEDSVLKRHTEKMLDRIIGEYARGNILYGDPRFSIVRDEGGPGVMVYMCLHIGWDK